jgi:hypothetical protein
VTDLKQLFKTRDEAVDKLTAGILKAIPNVIEAAQQFVRDREGTTGILEWKDVSYFEEDGYIMFIGLLEYQTGDTVTLPNGSYFELSEHNLDHFKRVIRLGVPYDLAASGTVEEVLKFLEASADDDSSEAQVELEEFLQLPVSEVDNTEFDLDALTDEQKEQLRLFALSNGGNN